MADERKRFMGMANPRNIDAMVAAGEITAAEGERLKAKAREAQKPKSMLSK